MKISNSPYKLSAVFLATTLFCVNANAGVVVLDDFSQSSDLVKAPPSAVGVPTLGTDFWNQRTLSIFNATGTPEGGAYALVTRGVLSINNGNLVNATAQVSYNFNFDRFSAALANATYFELSLDQVFIDNQTVVVGGGARVNAQNGLTVLLASGSNLTVFQSPFNVQFRSDFTADSNWDNLKLTYTCKAGATAADLSNREAPDQCGTNGVVPIAPSAALLGLGLIGLLSSTRMRRQSGKTAVH